MTESLMLDCLRNVWEHRTGGLSNPPSMLCVDACCNYLTDDVKKMHSLRNDLIYISGGMTYVLQPLDVSINKNFKGQHQAEYEKQFCEQIRELNPTGKIKRAAPHIVAHWVLAAWKSIEAPMIVKSFEKCCILNSLNGSEDDVFWNAEDDDDDEEEKSNESASDEKSCEDSSDEIISE